MEVLSWHDQSIVYISTFDTRMERANTNLGTQNLLILVMRGPNSVRTWSRYHNRVKFIHERETSLLNEKRLTKLIMEK